jgi:uncharacterized protein
MLIKKETKMKSAEYWIEKLQLEPHPEGGYFREIYRSSEQLPVAALPPRYQGPRCFGTSIYFLLKGDQVSCLHRLQSDEIWHFYAGAGLTLYLIDPEGTLQTVKLGDDPEQDENFSAIVPAGCWFGGRANVGDSYTLLGCTVAPGFDFADFELGERQGLLDHYPQHCKIVKQLTKAY